MKQKLLAMIMILTAGIMSAHAQDQSCLTNSSISHENVKAKNYKAAYEPWKAVMKECPTLKYYTYTDGFDIIESFLKADKKGTTTYQAYFDELMATYDQLLKHLSSFTAKGVPSTSVLIGRKAMAYMTYAPKIDPEVAYKMFRESTDVDKASSSPNAWYYLLSMSFEILKNNPAHKEQFIQDYLNTTDWADAVLEKTTNERTKQGVTAIKDNLVAFFINSGAATCESLEEIYKPQVEAKKTDLEFLGKVLNIMNIMKCTDNDTYFQASLYSYKIKPTAAGAVGCASMAYKKGDFATAGKYFDEAIDLSENPKDKAENAYKAAVAVYAQNQYGNAKKYLLEAIRNNPNMGSAYILLAHLYVANSKWSDEPLLNSCTYYVVIDKLQRAKQVDPSVADEANKYIRKYSEYLPKVADLFMLGKKVGDKVEIGGLINETATIR